MPRLLKSETARRLRVGQRALSIAFSLISTPKSVSHQGDKSDGAIELGLVGIGAELAISACLYEILGPGAIIRKDSGFYITAGEALAKFRAALASGIPRLSLLTQGIGGAAEHLKSLDRACAGFKVLFTSRAAAVHAGQGASSDVVFCVGKDVAHFFELLAESPKWKPYLKDAPAVPALPKERTIIAQELAAAVKGKDKGAVVALANIFLVLPDLSKDGPEWLSALERVHVNAKPNDISILLKSLESATVGDLMKVGKGASGIAAKIDPDNPNAVPIYIAGMKKKFENASDSWNAYVGTANAEIDRGVLSLPPIAAVYGFSAIGIDGIGLPAEETSDGLPAHVLWPFIASALNYNGTKGPCFFLARSLRADAAGQLTALLNKAAIKSNTLVKSLKDFFPLLDATVAKESAPINSTVAGGLTKSGTARDENRENLEDILMERRKQTSADLKSKYDQLIAIFTQSDSVGACIAALVEGNIDLKDEKFSTLRTLIAAASDQEDIAPLARIIGDNDLKMLATPARKAIAEIDYALYGPQTVKKAE